MFFKIYIDVFCTICFAYFTIGTYHGTLYNMQYMLINYISHVGLYYYIIIEMTFYDFNVIDVITTK